MTSDQGSSKAKALGYDTRYRWSYELLSVSGWQLRLIVELITGHGNLKVFHERTGKVESPELVILDEDYEEIPIHILSEYPALGASDLSGSALGQYYQRKSGSLTFNGFLTTVLLPAFINADWEIDGNTVQMQLDMCTLPPGEYLCFIPKSHELIIYKAKSQTELKMLTGNCAPSVFQNNSGLFQKYFSNWNWYWYKRIISYGQYVEEGKHCRIKRTLFF